MHALVDFARVGGCFELKLGLLLDFSNIIKFLGVCGFGMKVSSRNVIYSFHFINENMAMPDFGMKMQQSVAIESKKMSVECRSI